MFPIKKHLLDLFEDLAVGVGVLLAIDGDALLPAPAVLDELAVGSIVGVELLEGVALVVGSDIEDGEVVLATDDESTLDDGVVVLAVDGSASEDVLAGSLKTGVKATNQVVGHEDQGKLIVVLVVDLPDGELVKGDGLPEVLHSLGGRVVGVVALEVIKSVGGLAESLNGVLGLGLGGLLVRGSSSGSRSSGGGLLLGGSFLLGGDVGKGNRLEESRLVGHSRVDGLSSDGLVPTGGSGVSLLPSLVEEELETAESDTSREEISECDALADEVGVVSEVLLEDVENLGSLDSGLIDSLLVVDSTALEREVLFGKRVDDLSVEERQPLQDGGVASLYSSVVCSSDYFMFVSQGIDLLLLGLAEEGGLLVLGSDFRIS